MTKQKAARRSSHYKRAFVPLVKKDRYILSRASAEHERYENFQRGSLYAAIALCAMFAFLSAGVWWFGW